MEKTHIDWSRNHFAFLADGGVWGIPRSGLVFRKRGRKLVLTNVMPHEPGMPLSEAELIAQQEADYEQVKAHFEAAGVVVEKDLR